MKKISEYIDNKKFDYIDESILPHIAIEYKEHNLHNRNHLVLEKNGVYEGCSELADIISKDIKKRYEEDKSFEIRYNKDDFKDIKNIFFNDLIIDCEFSPEDDSGAEYEDNDSINKESMLFDEVYIDVFLETPSNIKPILMHELTHAWNNYNMLLKDNIGFFLKATSPMYSKITDVSYEDDEFVSNIKQILYFTLKEERNAFIAQLSGELEKWKDKVKSPKDALQVLTKSDVYISYKRLLDFVNTYTDKSNTGFAAIIARAYNEICGTELTVGKVMKKLQFLMRKSMKKVDVTVGKLCVEKLNNVVTMAPTNTWL